MKKILCMTALFILSSQSAFALLSPLNQSSIEIRSLLEEKNLYTYFPQNEPIVSITHTDEGYLVSTASHRVLVQVIYEVQKQPGAQPFQLLFIDKSSEK